MKQLSTVFSFLLLVTTPLISEDLVVQGHRLTMDKGFKVVFQEEGEPIQFRTPNSLPVSLIPLVKTSDQTWEATALDYLLKNTSREDPKILSVDTPEEIQIKREGPWTTIYWTYGGTKAYFGMYWGGRGNEESVVLFWASPSVARGRAQYQALSEITKGVRIGPS